MYLLKRIKQQIWHIINFALIFTILGGLIPDFYYKYIDKTSYYSVESAVVIQENVKKCENVDFVFKRTALEDLDIDGKVDLVLVNSKNDEQVYSFPRKNEFAGKGELLVKDTVKIPCNLEETGDFKLKLFASYYIKGFRRTTSFQTNSFKISD